MKGKIKGHTEPASHVGVRLETPRALHGRVKRITHSRRARGQELSDLREVYYEAIERGLKVIETEEAIA